MKRIPPFLSVLLFALAAARSSVEIKRGEMANEVTEVALVSGKNYVCAIK